MLLTYVFRILCQGSSLHRSPTPHEFHLRIVTLQVPISSLKLYHASLDYAN